MCYGPYPQEYSAGNLLGVWIFLPRGGTIVTTTLPISIPEQAAKPSLREAVIGLYKKLGAVGFTIFSALTTMLLLALTWGGGRYPWSCPTVLGLLCCTAGLAIPFMLWIRRIGNDGLMPPSSLRRRAVAVGSLVMFFQGGATQMIPYFLPFWFQAIRGDSPAESAVHVLPSLVANIVALVIFRASDKNKSVRMRQPSTENLSRSPQITLHPPMVHGWERAGQCGIRPPEHTVTGDNNRPVDWLSDCHHGWEGAGVPSRASPHFWVARTSWQPRVWLTRLSC